MADLGPELKAVLDKKGLGEKTVAALLDDPAARERMGALGRARVEGGLSWGHSAPVLLAAYDRAFAKVVRGYSMPTDRGPAIQLRALGASL